MSLELQNDPYLPKDMKIVEVIHETKFIFTFHLSFVEAHHHQLFHFYPGQFNMLYLYGVGEVPISIVSDPDNKQVLTHTIRAVGRVTKAMQALEEGTHIGVRGPFGRGWPLHQAQGKDVVVVTGGLGCAPTVSIINYILARRSQYGRLIILQGVKHSDDFIFRKHYEVWAQSPETEVHIAADQAGPKWPWAIGYVTDMIKNLQLNPGNTLVMMCGPEMMMRNAVKVLKNEQNIDESSIFLSMERNMACGLGHCGHCQYGGLFVCKDGPVFCFPEVKPLFDTAGF